MTADSLRKQLRLYVEGKRGNSHRVCAPQWGAEQHNGMFPHPHPDLPIQNQCIALFEKTPRWESTINNSMDQSKQRNFQNC